MFLLCFQLLFMGWADRKKYMHGSDDTDKKVFPCSDQSESFRVIAVCCQHPMDCPAFWTIVLWRSVPARMYNEDWFSCFAVYTVLFMKRVSAMPEKRRAEAAALLQEWLAE